MPAGGLFRRLKKTAGVRDGGLELLVALRLGRHAVFVENAAQHAAELLALVPQRALNQHLHLDRPVGRPARCIRRADIENAGLKLAFDAARADMRQRPERAHHEDRIPPAVDDRTLDGEFDRRLDVAVHELADGGRVEGVDLFAGEAHVDRRMPGGVLPHADDDAAALRIRQREAVAHDLSLRLPGHFRPAERRFVVQHVGFDAAVDEFGEIVRKFSGQLIHRKSPVTPHLRGR